MSDVIFHLGLDPRHTCTTLLYHPFPFMIVPLNDHCPSPWRSYSTYCLVRSYHGFLMEVSSMVPLPVYHFICAGDVGNWGDLFDSLFQARCTCQDASVTLTEVIRTYQLFLVYRFIPYLKKLATETTPFFLPEAECLMEGPVQVYPCFEGKLQATQERNDSDYWRVWAIF